MTIPSPHSRLTIALDPRVFVPPLSGIARTAQTIESSLHALGHSTVTPSLPLPHSLQNILWRSGLLRRTLPIDGRLGDAHIFHALWPFAPLPHTKNIKTVATIHDLIPLHAQWQQEFTAPIRRAFEKDLRRTLAQADHIHFVSEFTKRDALERFGIQDDPARMTVAHLGVHPLWFDTPPQHEHSMPAALQPVAELLQHHKHTLQQGFVLVVGSVLPHKNIQALIDAYDASFPPLLITGALSSDIDLNGKTNVVTTGYIDDMTLMWLYDNAVLSVFPSLHEGFGLPPLEAMARNCPVIASSTTSIPEVLGRAALLIDCRETSAIRDAIRDVLVSKELQQTLIHNGRAHVQQFTPLAFGQRLEALYTHVLRAA